MEKIVQQKFEKLREVNQPHFSQSSFLWTLVFKISNPYMRKFKLLGYGIMLYRSIDEDVSSHSGYFLKNFLSIIFQKQEFTLTDEQSTNLFTITMVLQSFLPINSTWSEYRNAAIQFRIKVDVSAVNIPSFYNEYSVIQS